jgi:hypothetical protein
MLILMAINTSICPYILTSIPTILRCDNLFAAAAAAVIFYCNSVRAFAVLRQVAAVLPIMFAVMGNIQLAYPLKVAHFHCHESNIWKALK